MTNYQSNQQSKPHNNTNQQNHRNDISKNSQQANRAEAHIVSKEDAKLDQILESLNTINQSLAETVDILSQFNALFKPAKKTDLINSYSNLNGIKLVDKEDNSNDTSL